MRGSGRVVGGPSIEAKIHELSIREAADALGVAPSTISRARRTGVMPRATRDPERLAGLKKAHYSLRRTKTYRTARTAVEQQVQAALASIGTGSVKVAIPGHGHGPVLKSTDYSFQKRSAATVSVSADHIRQRAEKTPGRLDQIIFDEVGRAYLRWVERHGWSPDAWAFHGTPVTLGGYDTTLDGITEA